MRNCQIEEFERIRGVLARFAGVDSSGADAIKSWRGYCDGSASSRMGFEMETKVLESVLVEFEPDFCFELAVDAGVMEKFELRRGQRVDRELMEEIIRANNEVKKELPAQDGEPFAVRE